jgi:hypothetical protein
LIAATSLLGLGTAYAAQVYTTPVQSKTSEVVAVRTLAQKLNAQTLGEAPVLQVPVLDTDPVTPPPAATPKPVVKPSFSLAKPSPVQHTQTAVAPSAPPQPSDPAKNIALIGVTHLNGADHALLMDVSTQERETVDQGGDVWGFKVRTIGDDHVTLANATEEVTLRLGEKGVPTSDITPTAEDDAAAQNGADGNGGNGRGGRRGRFQQWAQAAAAAGAFNRGGGGGGGRGNWASGGGNSFNSGGAGRGNYNRGGGTNFRTSGNNRGGAQYAMNFGGGGNFGNNRQPQQTAGPTSNPQTARRRGGQLVGGAKALPAVPTISNPQTARRLGTTSGKAFGSSQSNSRSGSQNRGR